MKLAAALFVFGLIPCLNEQTFGQSKVEFHSTDRLPDADGVAEIRRVSDRVVIHVRLDDMKPASLFGGDYSTYVFWLVASDGRTFNHGELQLLGDEGTLSITTNLKKFRMIVTAEPHYLVTAPSRFVIMEDALPGDRIEYRSHEGPYYYERDTLAGMPEANDVVRTDVQQAFAAVRLAQRAGADKLAHSEMAAADKALDLTLTLSQQGKDRHAIKVQARETVRLAVAAQRKAREEEIAQTGGGAREAQTRK